MKDQTSSTPAIPPTTAPLAPPQWSDGVAERNGGGANGAAARPDPEVLEKPERRKFNAAYKLRILQEAEASPGGVAGLLRREGLYSNHLATWKRQRAAGELRGLEPRKRGRKGRERNPLDERVALLEREKRRLEKRLKRAETIIDVQKKIAGLLGIPLSPVENDENDEDD